MALFSAELREGGGTGRDRKAGNRGTNCLKVCGRKSPTKRMWGRLGQDYTGSSNSAHRKWAKFPPEVHSYEQRKASVTISQSQVELTFTIGG